MIFCGDFVFPLTFDETIFAHLGKTFVEKPKIINFESTLAHLNKSKRTKGIALFSQQGSYKAMKYLNVVCASHANNHVADYNYDLKSYMEYFSKINIKPIGLGSNIIEATKPYINEEEKLLVLAFGWETIRCSAASKKSCGVNPYRYDWVEKQVFKNKKEYPNYNIVLFIHWNYEFEKYPQPADRQFAHHMIDIGVSGIFGHHPHIINGYEIYKNKPIFYSLGNFFFPQVKYGTYQLNFRESALEGISVDYNGNINDLKIFHHFQNQQGSFIKLLGVYKIGEFDKLTELSEFCNLNHKDYIRFYKKNRFHKRKLLPVYKYYTSKHLISWLNFFVRNRQIPIDILAKIKNIL